MNFSQLFRTTHRHTHARICHFQKKTALLSFSSNLRSTARRHDSSSPPPFSPSSLLPLALLLLHLEQQRTIDVWQYAAESDGGADEGVEFFVASDGELEVARGDALDLEVFGGVAGEFEDFGREVFEDGGDVHGSCVCAKMGQFVRKRCVLASRVRAVQLLFCRQIRVGRGVGISFSGDGGIWAWRTFSTDAHLVLGIVL